MKKDDDPPEGGDDQEPKQELTKVEKRNLLYVFGAIVVLLFFLLIAWFSGLFKERYLDKDITKEDLAKKLGVTRKTFVKTVLLLYPRVMGTKQNFIGAPILSASVANRTLRKFGMDLDKGLEIKDLLLSKGEIAKRCGTTTKKLLETIELEYQANATKTYKKIGISLAKYKQLNNLPYSIAKKIITFYKGWD